ncbi:MAG TPA: aspartate/glutamate racemase family protein [Pseudonocardia sp.]|uniref:aspartate/glutamate racemase family protein n=1 Tax=Pseudonocardia sp. TaxID=60912 RepID=UPI002ED7809E
MAKIAVLHTSFVFVNVELRVQQLLDEMLPDDEIIHFVDSDVLATVVREGGISADSEKRMVLLAEAAERAGADVIFSACSSLGPTLDAARKAVEVPIVKIDDAMATHAAANASRIGVLATVPTTLGPTADLIYAHAGELGRKVQVVQHLCEGAFQTLMGGDKAAHDEMVLAGALELAKDVEIVVLAQASMSRLQPSLEESLGIPVLSSPQMGIQMLADIAHGPRRP